MKRSFASNGSPSSQRIYVRGIAQGDGKESRDSGPYKDGARHGLWTVHPPGGAELRGFYVQQAVGPLRAARGYAGSHQLVEASVNPSVPHEPGYAGSHQDTRSKKLLCPATTKGYSAACSADILDPYSAPSSMPRITSW